LILRDGIPKIIPMRAANNPAIGKAIQKGIPSFVVRIAEVYAPTATNAPWPIEICPVNPVRILRPTAPTIKIKIMLVT
jgi:hypothetical protein